MSLANLISEALETVDDVAGINVIYRRGEASMVMMATPGTTEHPINDGDIATTWTSHDFLISTVNLFVGEEAILPDRGDVIEELSTGVKYEVLRPDGGDSYWRYSDTGRSRVRIHTVRKGADE